MSKGRKRLPDNVHSLRGTFRPHRHGKRKGVPLLPAVTLEAPTWLNTEAAAEFDRLVQVFADAQVLTEADEGLLALYAILAAEIADSHRKGESIAASRLAQFRLLCAELGLSPTSRTKVSPAGGSSDADNPFAEFDRPSARLPR